jgi:hypothetical protein
VLKHVKAVPGSHLSLQSFDFFVGEFSDLSALGAYQVIMMPPQVAVFVTDGLALKLLSLGKPQLHHAVHAVLHKLGVEIIAFFPKASQHFLQGDVFFRASRTRRSRPVCPECGRRRHPPAGIGNWPSQETDCVPCVPIALIPFHAFDFSLKIRHKPLNGVGHENTLPLLGANPSMSSKAASLGSSSNNRSIHVWMRSLFLTIFRHDRSPDYILPQQELVFEPPQQPVGVFRTFHMSIADGLVFQGLADDQRFP